MGKTLTISGLVIAALILAAAVLTTKTYVQLGVAMLLYPPLVYLLFKVFPRKNGKNTPIQPEAIIQPQAVPMVPVQPAVNVETADAERHVGIADIDKRVFLKLIGGAGLSLFLFSIFNKKVEGLFFKSVPTTTGSVSLQDTSGSKIDPAQSQPMDGYRISEIDDNVITFYGFTNKDGAWVVMREDSDTGSFRYAKGDANFPVSWSNRENLAYDYFSSVF